MDMWMTDIYVRKTGGTNLWRNGYEIESSVEDQGILSLFYENVQNPGKTVPNTIAQKIIGVMQPYVGSLEIRFQENCAESVNWTTIYCNEHLIWKQNPRVSPCITKLYVELTLWYWLLLVVMDKSAAEAAPRP